MESERARVIDQLAEILHLESMMDQNEKEASQIKDDGVQDLMKILEAEISVSISKLNN